MLLYFSFTTKGKPPEGQDPWARALLSYAADRVSVVAIGVLVRVDSRSIEIEVVHTFTIAPRIGPTATASTRASWRTTAEVVGERKACTTTGDWCPHISSIREAYFL